MSNNRGVNITQYLSNNKAFAPNAKVSTVNLIKTTNFSAVGDKSSITRILAYLLAIIVVILVILLFINFFITPIFRLRPGGPGIIPIPGFDDGTLFWNNTSAGLILNKDLPISSQAYGYSINLDVFIENPLQFAITPRVFFSRGATANPKPTGDTLLGLYSTYNLVAALLPDTNDLIVSVLNKDNNMENIIVPNVPIQQPFRLTMVVMEQALEVYMNGQLIKTRKFASTPMDVKGDIYPSIGVEINVIKVRNLKIWSRLLAVAEIRQATPSLSTAKDFGAAPMAGSTTSCSATAASTSSITSDVDSGMDRLSKLSVNTVPDSISKLF